MLRVFQLSGLLSTHRLQIIINAGHRSLKLVCKYTERINTGKSAQMIYNLSGLLLRQTCSSGLLGSGDFSSTALTKGIHALPIQKRSRFEQFNKKKVNTSRKDRCWNLVRTPTRIRFLYCTEVLIARSAGGRTIPRPFAKPIFP